MEFNKFILAPVYPTVEWAKQMAFNCGLIDAETDYVDLRCMTVHNTTVAVQRIPAMEIGVDYYTAYSSIDIRTVDMLRYYDHINEEIMWLAYIKDFNTLLVGPVQDKPKTLWEDPVMT